MAMEATYEQVVEEMTAEIGRLSKEVIVSRVAIRNMQTENSQLQERIAALQTEGQA
jgi:predicted  nucleic acid-binding Zn-ribbon protein